jgi:putative endonuclease
MSLHNKQLGKRGEEIALDYLINNKFKIIVCNYRSKFGEIDIVAQKENKIFFVEVKTRANLDKGMPYEAIDSRKKHQMRKAAIYFLLENDYKKYKYTLGVVSILFKGFDEVDLKFFESID